MSDIPGQIAELSPNRRELLFRRLRAGAGASAEASIPAHAGDTPPLSYAQQRLWFLDQLAPGQPVYNEAIAVRLTGPLDVPAFEAALGRIVARHAVLRTGFVSAAGRPSQNVLLALDVPLPVIDLVGEQEDKEQAALVRASEEARRPFRLDQPPLLRPILYRLDDNAHVFLLVVHHIVWDGWSTGVFFQELAELYEAGITGHPPRLPKLAPQYGDFAAWQREQLSGGGLTALREHWRAQLLGAPPVLTLSSMRPMPAQPSGRGERLPVALPPALFGDITALARRAEVTSFMVLLAAFATLLRRESGVADIVVGVGVAGRTRAELEPLIGLFVNILPIRIGLWDSPTTEALLKRVRDVCTDALSHQDFPFDLLVSTLKPPRVDGVPPLVQVVFDLQNVPQPTLRLTNLHVQPLLIDVGTARFDLTLLLWQQGDAFAGAIEYASDRFDRATVLGLVDRYADVLRDIVREPNPAPALDRAALREANRKKLLAHRAEQVDAPTAPSLPLRVEPVGGADDLAAWAADNRAFIAAKLALHGGILFRGFAVSTAAEFETFARTVSRELLAENGEHVPVAGMEFVQTPVFYAPGRKLLWHNENSFNQWFPAKIAFCCMQSAETGGETPLADSRAIIERIPRPVREEFIDKAVMYIRNYGVGPGLDWRVVFRTDDHREVERLCRENCMDFEWLPGDRLRTRCVRPAVIRHPQTGDLSWFNQVQHWHISCLDEATRVAIAETFAPADVPRTCCFGDGNPIADEAMATILAAYESIEVSFPWRRGDVMLLDNVLVAHARNPYRGERRLLVALGDLLSYAGVTS
jgi:alpha-ketoglutarate-dependent taurine dioxygenase